MPFSDPQQQAAMMMGLAMGLNVGMGAGFVGMPNAHMLSTAVGGSAEDLVTICAFGEGNGSEQQMRKKTGGCKAAGDRNGHGRRWDELDSHASAWRNFKKKSGKGKGKKKN
ncbi:hypothetical protein FRB90_007323 [Tulasnella sp. 427]|nr:hypothetical protein FRB90_007323 [Tulasnella sp. 427]